MQLTAPPCLWIRSILKFHDIDDVVERANAGPFGLGASVWSTDIESAVSVARRLDSGTVWINQHQALMYDVPFGGIKQSGAGCEFGEAGVLEYTARQVINQSRRV
ncbi:hypothetical protein B7R54_01830 [Subtercola boreus]|uniref:Aldehyde dehydrogenase domain-containing protein n=1 Tax=Subtercola boreus TaxID=120213 RepID=A0A3E0VEC8_9MICO|nr:aldehyde dehydrogenase family protein [Subtercola boreus]RFA08091.1 hypothetical protein B7R54_01830 [Subtercola boreus]